MVWFKLNWITLISAKSHVLSMKTDQPAHLCSLISLCYLDEEAVCPYLLFVCHYWQWPILINCVMCYFLCVLWWLMRPILALNCPLQIEQERSEEESSVGDALALAFRCARFCSASLILFASYSPAPLFMRPRHFDDPVQSVPMTLLVCWSL